jgi:hypothetical protein
LIRPVALTLPITVVRVIVAATLTFLLPVRVERPIRLIQRLAFRVPALLRFLIAIVLIVLSHCSPPGRPRQSGRSNAGALFPEELEC